MKYMIILSGSQQHYNAMAGKDTDHPTWSPEELDAMFAFMNELNGELESRGELVDGQGLTEPALARRVELKDGETVVTDGPYAESKEVLAGYWVVDVDGIDRATEIAAHVLTCPGPDGAPEPPIDIRPVGEAAPDEA